MEITACPECGSNNVEPDAEFEDMWCCKECNFRFLKHLVEEWTAANTEEYENNEKTAEDEDDFLTEGEQEDWGF